MNMPEGLTAEDLAEIARMEPEDERCVVGKCPYCGEIKDNLLPTNDGSLRCDECDSDYEWCGICKEDQRYDDHCRHIFQAEWGEWLGSGTAMRADELESVLITLLDLMPAGFSQDLRSAILSGNFYTWAMLPLIGGSGHLSLRGMRRCDWGDFLMEIGQGDDAEEIADAYHWLASLYKTDTPKANNTTVSWLNAYIAMERAARLHALPA